MKSFRYLLPFLILQLISCKKDKLEGENLILQGKWKWIETTEFKTSKYYPDSTFWRSALNHSNEYFFEFEKRGKMSIWKDESEIKWYRLNTDFNRESGSPTLADERSIRIYLNFNETKPLRIWMNEDTMFVESNYVEMPYTDYYLDLFHYSYRHSFVRIN